jgi:hypothetical protein
MLGLESFPGHRNLEIFVFHLLHDIDLLQYYLSLNGKLFVMLSKKKNTLDRVINTLR